MFEISVDRGVITLYPLRLIDETFPRLPMHQSSSSIGFTRKRP